MPIFPAPDGTGLAVHLHGSGAAPPVVCLPGGPMRAGRYLGDLGEVTDRRRIAVLDLRGTGDSEEPHDPASYRCDRQVEDVEALRKHLGLDRFDLLGHSAGASLALHYAARYPERLRRLALIAPSPRAVGFELPAAERRRIVARRAGAPWFAAASTAYEAIAAKTATAADWSAVAPLYYGRWDSAAQRHHAGERGQRNGAAARIYNSAGAFEPGTTRAALGAVTVPCWWWPVNWTGSPARRSPAASPGCSRTAGSSCCPGPRTTRGWTTHPRSPQPWADSWPEAGLRRGLMRTAGRAGAGRRSPG
ncbi:alpha/beta fold hydrolase [Amycolatopsis vancoresmycina]|uniref:Hydrolase n=1 Tax=Amycolatopsis vancoresmycina DSM 44592 TaxID=1292037 RepID=R1HNV1_9PSEU|nr:alpha/beta hydrolase [Amycolatopsis vancoresmycina]EOD65220.1 hydrolase [Amycolatopsis vancoresmycina DSM 44592]